MGCSVFGCQASPNAMVPNEENISARITAKDKPFLKRNLMCFKLFITILL
jgi:hypothetical protein